MSITVFSLIVRIICPLLQWASLPSLIFCIADIVKVYARVLCQHNGSLKNSLIISYRMVSKTALAIYCSFNQYCSVHFFVLSFAKGFCWVRHCKTIFYYLYYK